MPGWCVLGAPLDCSATGRGEASAPGALRAAGLVDALGADDAGDVEMRIDDPARDVATGLIAYRQLVDATAAIRSAVTEALVRGLRPLVLGGDCTALIGAAAAARDHEGQLQLVFVDGQPDYLDGGSSPTGEAADMDLAILNGHGPPGLADLAHPTPIVAASDVVVIGHRRGELGSDAADERARLPEGVGQVDADTLVSRGGRSVAAELAGWLTGPWWLHLDLDVFDEDAFPAVTYPQPGGPGLDDVAELIAGLPAEGLIGVTVSDLRPDLDPDGAHTRRLVELLAASLPGGT